MSNSNPPGPGPSNPGNSGPFSPIGGDPFHGGGMVPGQQPNSAKTLAWLTLGTALWSFVWGFIMLLLCGWCCFLPMTIYQFIVAVAGTVHGTRMLANNRIPPSGGLTVAYIVCIINLDVLSLCSGIVQSTLRNDERVRAWYRIP
ncbi:MAG: hypothetical protein JJU11_17680 [Candidatus Sumerlaeia bacterium]|nr:hypothetical protein [Candidatus Sumerlaeia bacterium]